MSSATKPVEQKARELLIERLREAARWSDMPVGEQIRFESMLAQLSGERTRKDPLPFPVRHGGGNG